MNKKSILITGANGEIGKSLIKYLSIKFNHFQIITLDLKKLEKDVSNLVDKEIIGNILDQQIINKLKKEYQFDSIYHLAALLSTKAESLPLLAHDINVGGTLNLLNLAREQGLYQNRIIKFFFPSSIAVYGFQNLKEKQAAGIIKEDQFLNPITMYGCNKLYCEYLGSYYSDYYHDAQTKSKYIDFRSIRFPGIISSITVPSGGTSDYIPEMLHSVAQNKEYKCFVRPDSKIPFITMYDAVQAIILLMQTSISQLKKRTYNISAFAPTANEFKDKILDYYPKAIINYDVNVKRQSMVDSWPEDINDLAAQVDWSWQPKYRLKEALSNYLIPEINKLYSQENNKIL